MPQPGWRAIASTRIGAFASRARQIFPLTLRERARITVPSMLRKYTIEVLVMAFIGAVLAFIGPFGSFALPLGTRMLYWMALILIGFPVYRGSGVVARWLADATHIPPAVSLLITIGLASIPMTAIVAAMFFQISPGRAVNWNGVGQLYLQVWLIAALITGFTQLLFREPPSDGAARAEVATKTPPQLSPAPETQAETRPTLAPENTSPLLDLPPGFGSVLALQSEDHYVRIHGAERSHLVLMRLRDAVAQMPADTGLQVHRSWWVAREAVRESAREGRAAALILTNGVRVPVSRDNMAAVRSAKLV